MAEKTIEQYEYDGSTINKLTTNCWMFIHDGSDVIHQVSYNEGCVHTLENIYGADTEQECLDKISELGLNNPFTTVNSSNVFSG